MKRCKVLFAGFVLMVACGAWGIAALAHPATAQPVPVPEAWFAPATLQCEGYSLHVAPVQGGALLSVTGPDGRQQTKLLCGLPERGTVQTEILGRQVLLDIGPQGTRLFLCPDAGGC